MIIKKIILTSIFILFSIIAFSQESIDWACVEYFPAIYKTEKEEITGVIYEIILELFENRLKIPVEINMLPWKRCQILVELGELDFITTIPTKERLNYAVTTSPLFTDRSIIYSYKENPNLEKISKIRDTKALKEANLKVLSYNGDGWSKNFLEKTWGMKVIYADDLNGMFRMLAFFRGDVIISTPIVVNKKIKELDLPDVIIKTKGYLKQVSYTILISKKSPYVSRINEFDKILGEMNNEGFIDDILKKYGVR